MDKQLYEFLIKFIAYAEGTTETTEQDFYLFLQDAKNLVKTYEKLYL
jgi:hypothetical protein